MIKIFKNQKIRFITIMLIGIIFLLLGIFHLDDLLQMRMEGSAL